MKKTRGMFDLLRTTSSQVMSQGSELLKSPAFLRAVETVIRGKEMVNGAVEQTMKRMDVPTRTELKRAVARIEALERGLADRPRRAAPSRAKGRAPARRKKALPTRG